MLSIRDLHIKYNNEKEVVKGISFDVADGEVVCLCGGSGCGKTSILKAVLGYVDYTGDIILDGVRVTDANTPAMRMRMAYVPQEFVMPHETVRDMIQAIMDLSANVQYRRSETELLEEWKQLGLSPDILEKQSRELSGGQRQRVMLSVSGMLGRRLLLVDEPTSALDSDTTRFVAEYILRLARQNDMAVLAVSHSEVFASMCDRILKL